MNISTSQDTFTAKYGMDSQYPLSPEEWERYAKECMDPGAFGYIQSGAGGQESMKANQKAFKRWQIKPRVLRDVSAVDTSVEIMGRMRLSFPIMGADSWTDVLEHLMRYQK